MAWWGSLAFKLKGWIVGIGAAIAAIFGIYLYGLKSGSYKQMQRQAEADRKKSREIEDAADRVRRADGNNLSPVERLRGFKRIRDISDDL